MGRYLLIGVLTLLLVSAAGPVLAELAKSAVPLVVAAGLVAVVLRLVWHYTNRHY